MSALEDKYNVLRKNLDSVGYHQPLSFGSMDLVGNLLNDILYYKSGNSSIKDMADELLQKKNNLKRLKLSLNKDEKPNHLLKMAEEQRKNQPTFNNSTLTKSRTSRSDKCADFIDERTEKSCQTASFNELNSEYKFVDKIEEQHKEIKSKHLSQFLVKNEGEDIVPLQCAFEKIKAERDYYYKEYHLLQEWIYRLFIENCSPSTKEQAFCIDNINKCQGDHLRLLINGIGKLLRCKRTASHIKETELQDMVMSHQRERAVLLLKSERTEQKIQKIKKQYQNLSLNKSKIVSENYRLQENLVKKDEELRSAISTQQKTEIKLNNAHKNLVAISTENDCLKDKIKQKDEYVKKMEKNLVSQANSIKTLSELKKQAENEIISLRKKTGESEEEIKELKRELCRSSHEINQITKENERLVVAVMKLTQEKRHLHQDLDVKKQRIKDLKREIHRYVSEVRRVEEAIESKEQELQNILEIYRVVSDEETSVMRNKPPGSLESCENFVTDYFENIDLELTNFEAIKHKDGSPQELQEKEIGSPCHFPPTDTGAG